MEPEQSQSELELERSEPERSELVVSLITQVLDLLRQPGRIVIPADTAELLNNWIHVHKTQWVHHSEFHRPINSSFPTDDNKCFAEAAQAGHVSVCQWICCVKRYYTWDGYNEWTLPIAAKFGNSVLCEWIVNKFGNTQIHGTKIKALSEAANYGHAHIIRLLYDLGILTLDMIQFSNTLYVAAKYGWESVIRCLKDLGLHTRHSYLAEYGYDALRQAVANNKPQAIRALHYLGLNATDARHENNALLKLAVINGFYAALAELHAMGLTAEDARVDNNWSLKRAIDSGYDNTVRELADMGLTVEDARSDDNACLKMAVKRDNASMVILLHSMGLTVDDARQVFAMAIKRGNAQVIEALWKMGLTVEDARDDDNFALQHACINGNVPMIQILRKMGITLEDARCHTYAPLRLAMDRQYESVILELKDMGITRMDAKVANDHAKKQDLYTGKKFTTQLLVSTFWPK